jgi:hypothetical protein
MQAKPCVNSPLRRSLKRKSHPTLPPERGQERRHLAPGSYGPALLPPLVFSGEKTNQSKNVLVRALQEHGTRAAEVRSSVKLPRHTRAILIRSGHELIFSASPTGHGHSHECCASPHVCRHACGSPTIFTAADGRTVRSLRSAARPKPSRTRAPQTYLLEAAVVSQLTLHFDVGVE